MGDKSLANQVLYERKIYLKCLKKFFQFEFSHMILFKSSDLKKFMVFELIQKKKLILISIKNNLRISDMENLGGEFYGRIKQDKSKYFNFRHSIVKYNNFS